MVNLKLNRGQNEIAPGVGTTEDDSVASNVPGERNTAGPSMECDKYTTAGESLQEVIRDLNDDWRTRKLASESLSKVYRDLARMTGYRRLSNGISPGKRAISTYTCASYLEFSGPSKDQLHLAHANFCRDRLCPQCNKRRSLKIFSQTSAIMDYLQQQYPDYQYIFMTMTIRNCSSADLAATIDRLQEGWRWLYHQSGYFRRKHKRDSEPVFMGSFRSLEVKLSQDGRSWHPHLHVIVAVQPDYFRSSGYLTTSDLVQLWRRACRLDYDPVCWIEAVSGSESGYRDAVCEVSKYVVKSNDYITSDLDLSVSRVLPLLLSLHKRRLCSYTGCFLKARQALALDDPVDGDLVNVDGQLRSDVSEVVYRFGWKCGVYVMLERGEVK